MMGKEMAPIKFGNKHMVCLFRCVQIGNCSRLGVLSLRENSLWHLPTELGKLRRLQVLDVSGNRFVMRFVLPRKR